MATGHPVFVYTCLYLHTTQHRKVHACSERDSNPRFHWSSSKCLKITRLQAYKKPINSNTMIHCAPSLLSDRMVEIRRQDIDSLCNPHQSAPVILLVNYVSYITRTSD
jgi:hypothetical protein